MGFFTYLIGFENFSSSSDLRLEREREREIPQIFLWGGERERVLKPSCIVGEMNPVGVLWYSFLFYSDDCVIMALHLLVNYTCTPCGTKPLMRFVVTASLVNSFSSINTVKLITLIYKRTIRAKVHKNTSFESWSCSV